jgi:hypothetical protein
MLKRLKSLNVNADILVVDNGSPHGFLNMQKLTDETHEAYVETLNAIKEVVMEMMTLPSSESASRHGDNHTKKTIKSDQDDDNNEENKKVLFE